ncbi:MAG: hypothetical protein KGL52_09520 [Rhodospirillales bacterium]|nr:hypothetical protein [Rhodospirillales bacterium]
MTANPDMPTRPHTRGGSARTTKSRGPSYIVAAVMGDPEAAARHMQAWKDASVAVIPAGGPTGRRQDSADPPIFMTPRQWKILLAQARARTLAFGRNSTAEDAASGEPDADPRPGINHDAFAPDARAMALLRGRKIIEADLRAAGGTYDLASLRTLLHGVSRQRIERMVREGSLLAVPGPSHRRRYPTVQFQADGTVVPGLKAVRAALPTGNPWAVLNFLVQPDDRLNGRAPIDMLKAGAVDEVVAAARSMGRQGA